MIENRSVPPKDILPHIVYPDVSQAIAWLSKTFDFTLHYHYGDPPDGAQLHLGNAWIMVNRAPAKFVTLPHDWAHPLKASPFSSKMSNLTTSAQNPPAQKLSKNSTKRNTANSNTAWKISPAIAGSSPATPATSAPATGAPLSRDPPIASLCFLARDSATSKFPRKTSTSPRHSAQKFLTGISVRRTLPAPASTTPPAKQSVSPDNSAWIATFPDPAGNALRLYTDGLR